MGLLDPHLDDAAFAEVWADRLASGNESDRHTESHLRACAQCRTRYSAFCGWLEGLRNDAFAEADEAFSAERLACQQAHILRRLEALEHPARVIAFPRFARPIGRQSGGPQRWVAAAAAAGLVVGVGLGQLFDIGGAGTVRQPDGFSQPQQLARGQMAAERRPVGVVPAVSSASDEALLYDQEMAPSQVRVPESLQYLNAITPGARDIEIVR